MPRLWGTLALTGLPALVRFLGEVGATGRLRVSGSGQAGELWLDGGRLVAARSGGARGRAALDVLALPDGDFVFADEALGATPDEELVAPDSDVYVLLETAVARRARFSPLLGARWMPVPVAAGGVAGGGDPEEALTLDLEAVRTLLAVNRGQDTLEALAAGGDPEAAAVALETLRDLGLVRSEPLTPAPPAPMSEEEERSPADETPPAPRRFRPTGDWQEVPSGTPVPPGGEYRMELGGKVYARWPDGVPQRAPSEAQASAAR